MYTVTFMFVEAMDRYADTFDAAVELGRQAGFTFIVTKGNERLASWCPMAGLRDYRQGSRPASRPAVRPAVRIA